MTAVRYVGPPPAKAWADKDPVAAARLAAARSAVEAIAEQHRLPVENLLAPDAVRRLCWEPPLDIDADGVASALREYAAREWQIGLTAAALTDAISR
jgi:ribonuclease D